MSTATLRTQPTSTSTDTSTPQQQSRPMAPNSGTNKKIGLWKKLTTKQASLNSSTRTSITANASSSSFSSGTMHQPRSLRSFRGGSIRNRQKQAHDATSQNLMVWLQTECPQDLLPQILAFAGPQMIYALSKTNTFWKEVIDQQSTWRTISEGLYKWREGDKVPDCWKDFYMFNPCVPVDYPSIHAALAVVRTERAPQTRSIRVLLRPGRYILREAISVQAPSSAEVVIETLEMPDTFDPVIQSTPVESTETTRKRRNPSSFRNMLSCRTVEVEDEEEDIVADLSFESPVATSVFSTPNNKRASLVLRTRKNNEPVIRVRQGCCIMKNLDLRHISHGIDIWNGNAAVQIQPPLGPEDQPSMLVAPPTVVMEHVEITSASGRGIVNIDGGDVTIRNCYVHDCAATGIYIGGPGSKAVIEQTDVVKNGEGNSHHRRGIARGHSGIYLEQGHADIRDCNISSNALTGISAVSPSNAILNLVESDLVANGTYQLEMPPVGTFAHTHSNTDNNNMSHAGVSRPRSGLVTADE